MVGSPEAAIATEAYRAITEDSAQIGEQAHTFQTQLNGLNEHMETAHAAVVAALGGLNLAIFGADRVDATQEQLREERHRMISPGQLTAQADRLADQAANLLNTKANLQTMVRVVDDKITANVNGAHDALVGSTTKAANDAKNTAMRCKDQAETLAGDALNAETAALSAVSGDSSDEAAAVRATAQQVTLGAGSVMASGMVVADRIEAARIFVGRSDYTLQRRVNPALVALRDTLTKAHDSQDKRAELAVKAAQHLRIAAAAMLELADLGFSEVPKDGLGSVGNQLKSIRVNGIEAARGLTDEILGTHFPELLETTGQVTAGARRTAALLEQ